MLAGAAVDGPDVLLACQKGHHHVLQALLEAGAPVSATNANGMSGLMTACFNGNFECVRVLTRASANLEQRYKDGMSALHVAAGCRFSGCLVALLQARITKHTLTLVAFKGGLLSAHFFLLVSLALAL